MGLLRDLDAFYLGCEESRSYRGPYLDDRERHAQASVAADAQAPGARPRRPVTELRE